MEGGSAARFSPAAAWARALQNVASLDEVNTATLPVRLDELAVLHADRPALVSAEGPLSYGELARRCRQYAGWATAQGLKRGDTVALMMRNCAEYPVLWLGITRVGTAVALLNPELTGDALLHACRVSGASHIIGSADLLPRIAAIRADLPEGLRLWPVGTTGTAGETMLDPQSIPAGPVTAPEQPPVRLSDLALLIFTSGTTGRPKAARISHYRVLEWGGWFAGMMNAGPEDRLYDCLPLHHSTGGIVGVASMLMSGGTVVIRERFSASRFWEDVAAERCTIFLYIGELCRYLASAPEREAETGHHLRLCCGNGMREEVWRRFQARFRIPRILEFYASTEGNVSLYNCEGQPGAIGRVPPFLARRFPVALVACDPDTGELKRGADGLALACGPDEPGEALGRIGEATARFEGYTDPEASEHKIARHVMAAGDAWFRTGDLMRRDRAGFFHFIDRLGDTFRWKGENVSTTEVAEAVGSCPGVIGACVYGVAVPGMEGRAGMAAISVGAEFTMERLFETLSRTLPVFARPVFLRIRQELDSTATFKPLKSRLAEQGFRPNPEADPVYLIDPDAATFRLLEAATLAQLEAVALRL